MARDTAGLRCEPEIFPTEYAIAINANPKANAIGSEVNAIGRGEPMLIKILFAATAEPHPKATNTKVPINSAIYFLI